MRPTYRQRLTGIGYCGLALLIAAPLLFGVLIGLSEGVNLPAILGASISAIAGCVMLLVGREHYAVDLDAKPKDDYNKALDDQEAAWRKLEGDT